MHEDNSIMGKRSSQKKNAAMLDTDGSDSVSSSSTFFSENMVESAPEEVQFDEESFLDECVDALYEKRGTTREKALDSIIKAFCNKVQREFVEKSFATLLSHCLNSIKRGSAREISLASHLIGLLALTTASGDKADEILEESIVPISDALKSRTDASKISSLLECLAIITFVGGEEPEQVEKSLQMMWQVANPKLGPNVVAAKSTPAITATVASTWAFLLTTVDTLSRTPKSWQESIVYFSSLLEKGDRTVRIAAGEAIALIFESGNFEKLAIEIKASSDATESRSEKSKDLIHINGLKSKVLDQVRNLSAESSGKGSSKKDLNSQRSTFRDILEFLEDGYVPETSMKIGGKSLITQTWAELIQLNFIKHFLGGGFVVHMQENEFLQDFLGFTPEKSLSGAQHRLSGSEKLNKKYRNLVQAEETTRTRNVRRKRRMFKSPNSCLNKARTQLRSKQRMLSQNMNTGHYGV